MARKYDSSRRTEAASRTREAILAAAFKLHGMGLLDMEMLAQEAGVSLATVRKHFPTRERLYEACTAYGMHFVPLPDLDALASATDASTRTRLAVKGVYDLHEALLGQTWAAYQAESTSAVLYGLLRHGEELVRAITSLVVDAWPDHRGADEALGFVNGMLSPLTYRALRVHGGLTADQARAVTEGALLAYLAGPERKEAAYVPTST